MKMILGVAITTLLLNAPSATSTVAPTTSPTSPGWPQYYYMAPGQNCPEMSSRIASVLANSPYNPCPEHFPYMAEYNTVWLCRDDPVYDSGSTFCHMSVSGWPAPPGGTWGTTGAECGLSVYESYSETSNGEALASGDGRHDILDEDECLAAFEALFPDQAGTVTFAGHYNSPQYPRGCAWADHADFEGLHVLINYHAHGTEYDYTKRCCDLNTKYGVVPGVTWGGLTHQTDRDWYNAVDCNTLIGGSSVSNCYFHTAICKNYDWEFPDDLYDPLFDPSSPWVDYNSDGCGPQGSSYTSTAECQPHIADGVSYLTVKEPLVQVSPMMPEYTDNNWVEVQSGTCEDQGYETIHHRGYCKLYAEQSGRNWKGESTGSNIPLGCYDYGSNQVWYHPPEDHPHSGNHAGETDCSGSRRCKCAVPGTQPIAKLIRHDGFFPMANGTAFCTQSPGCCYGRMPSGCDQTMGETSTPMEWFLDNNSSISSSTACANQKTNYDSRCGRTDALSVWVVSNNLYNPCPTNYYLVGWNDNYWCTTASGTWCEMDESGWPPPAGGQWGFGFNNDPKCTGYAAFSSSSSVCAYYDWTVYHCRVTTNTEAPTALPTTSSTNEPTVAPSSEPTVAPSNNPTMSPTTNSPTTAAPTYDPDVYWQLNEFYPKTDGTCTEACDKHVDNSFIGIESYDPNVCGSDTFPY